MSGTTSPLNGLKIIVMGVSGCGKSHLAAALAAHYDVPFIEGDAIHSEKNVAKMSAGTALTDEDRWPWLDNIGFELATAGKGGAVGACSALRAAYRDRLRFSAGGSILFIHLTVDPEVLFVRMRARSDHFMPASLLRSQLATLELPDGEKGVVSIKFEQHFEANFFEAVRLIQARVLVSLI